LQPQQETQQRKQQSSCAVASCHGPRPQAIKKHHPVRRPVTAASTHTQKSNCAALAAASLKKEQSTFAACRICKKKKKQSTCESAGESSREKQQSTCARARKHHKKTQQQSTGRPVAAATKKKTKKNNNHPVRRPPVRHGPQPQARKNTIILCGDLSWPQARKQNEKKQQSTCAAWLFSLFASFCFFARRLNASSRSLVQAQRLIAFIDYI